MSETILLTGATGKIGGNLAQHLIQRGERLRLLLMPNDPQAERLQRFAGAAEVVTGDLTDPASLQRAVQGVDAVIHLASIGHAAANEAAFFQTDVQGAYHLLQAAAHARPSIRRFVTASSFAVYGKPRYIPIDEHCPREPNSTLGLVKLTCELMCQTAWRMYGLPTVAFRFAWVHAGPDIMQALRMRQLRHRIRADVREQLAGRLPDDQAFVGLADEAGHPWTLHVVDVRDVVQGLTCALTSDGAPGEVFNLAAPSPVSLVEGARYFAQALGEPYVELRVPQLERLEISTAKARALIGYCPQFDFQRRRWPSRVAKISASSTAPGPADG
jgi:nucleoside-diphosphate-sugar epimerase